MLHAESISSSYFWASVRWGRLCLSEGSWHLHPLWPSRALDLKSEPRRDRSSIKIAIIGPHHATIPYFSHPDEVFGRDRANIVRRVSASSGTTTSFSSTLR